MNATRGTTMESSKVKRQILGAKILKYARQIPAYLILIAWSSFTAFSLLWIVMTSLKTNRELFANVWAFPAKFTFENYIKAWDAVRLGEYFMNSVIAVGSAVLILLLISAPASYALSRIKFKGNNLLTTLFTAGMGVPVPLLFIPLFFILTRIRLINTLPGLILIYVTVSIPFTVYILTGFFSTLPVELEEAAVIDGCTDLQVFSKVMLPLASPGLITAAIFNFIFLWNEYQLALVFISEPKNRTLSLGLYAMQNAMQFTSDWVGLMAGVVIVMIPTIILYVTLSEKVISGITMGAVKS